MKYRKLRKYKYQLMKPEKYRLPITGIGFSTPFIGLGYDGMLHVRVGYSWDGPSGPTFDTSTFMRGSLIHDALYQLIRQGHLKPEHRAMADRILYDICREDGMCWMRARYVYRSVRMFGKGAAKPDTDDDKVYEAP